MRHIARNRAVDNIMSADAVRMGMSKQDQYKPWRDKQSEIAEW